MEILEVQFLIPCAELEELTVHRDSREANELLVGWTTLYHPALIAATGKLPRWSRAERPPGELNGRLVIIPGASHGRLPEGWLQEVRTRAAAVVESYQGREDLLQRISAAGIILPELPPELVQNFFALGFCHYQVELLTRQLRYMSYLDSVGLEYRATEAAKALVAGDFAQARERLQRAFDILVEGREYFYPSEATLIDLVLVAPSTLGPELLRALEQDHPISLLLDGATLRQMAEKCPEAVSLLRQRVEAGTACVVGGEDEPGPLTLLPLEDWLADLLRGLKTFEEILGVRPTIFGRRPFGLSPFMPQTLQSLEFRAALHFALDEGIFPTTSQSRIRWEGIGGAVIDAISRVPLDASVDETFLRFGTKAGEVMDLDHTAAVILAHWPDKVSHWFAELKRVTKFSHVLGQFGTLKEFLEKSYYSGQNRKFAVHEYRSPYLRQAVSRGSTEPVSSWPKKHTAHLSTLGEATEKVLASLLCPSESVPPKADQLAECLAKFITAGANPVERGCLIVNPWSFPRLAVVDWPYPAPPPPPGGIIRASGPCGNRQLVVVQVPAMGFAWVGPGLTNAAANPPRSAGSWLGLKRKKSSASMVEEDTLRNEFLEVRINRTTGGIRAIRSYTSGANALGEELALRLTGADVVGPEGDIERFYTIMACDSFEVRAFGPVVAEVATRGRLVTRTGRVVARYEQEYRLLRGRPWLEILARLEPYELPKGDPWRHYYCFRFAWADATSSIHSGVHYTVQPFEGERLESPYFVHIQGEKSSFTILCGGLPYHRVVGVRKLDTLLVVPGELAREFRVGIAADVPHPAEAAIDFLAPHPAVVSDAPRPRVLAGWFFHISARNVIATSWQVCSERNGRRAIAVRLLETEGRQGTLRLRCLYPPQEARKVNFLGQPISTVPVQDDSVFVDIRPFEWCQVEIVFPPRSSPA
ncbi:MAG: hypothetical protein RMJ16_13445 [Thermoguttaceae bacterium]|nr:hypothetical protein [Thermoguttaceae bacterium]